ncbi:hypothetical protein GCM10022224_103790 [Nonomuraea antimicrobica]|uniref:Uncharacterized protein n=1 Tax=Nonomuraea antimicrobica TaxID=561173 RepID=A0ABP7EMG0_9ACTN
MSSYDGSYEVHASIQLSGTEHPLGGAEVTWDVLVNVAGLVPASVVLNTTALRVEGGKEDLPVTVGGVAVRRDALQVTLQGGRHVWPAS